MEKIYLSFLLAILLSGCLFPALAQSPVDLGSSAELLARYQAKVPAKPNSQDRNLAGEEATIRHTIPGRANLTLRVNGSKKEGDSEVIFGHVAGTTNTFFLKASRNKLSGYILLKDQKIAYAYSSASNGRAYLSQVDINKVVCIDYARQESKPGPTEREAGLMAASAVPELQSLPGATAVVLLDFDGQYVVNPGWNGGNPINAEPALLSEAEILEVWKMISEDYKPFSLNITTSEAIYQQAPTNRRMRIIFTPTNHFYTNVGGVAYTNSFTWGDDTPCWAFNSTAKYAGEVGSHEVGHTLGLSHDGRTSPAETYFWGQSSWAPIMGTGYDRQVVQWSKGEYPYANNTEDDLYTITTGNGFSYRTDDHSNENSNATAIKVDASGNVAASANKGIITTRADVDVFTFASSGASVFLSVSPSAVHPNLDISLTVKNSLSQTILQTNPAGMAASINQAFPAGTYYLYVDGAKGESGANSDYGSIGEYTISGKITLSNTPPQVSISSPIQGSSFAAPASISLHANASDQNGSISKVEFYNGSTKLGEDLSAPYSFSWTNVATGNYTLTAKATDNLGVSTISKAVSVNVVTAGLPSPWKNADIGAVALAGKASYTNGRFTLQSGGFDFYKAPDAFQYVYQPLSGDATILAKIESMGNTHSNALAGIMIRESLSASATFVALAANASNTNFMWRQGAGTPGYKQVGGSAPRWLKLSRNGNTFTSFVSTDGTTWTQAGSTSLTMGSNLYVGLALTSQNTTQLNTGIFSNVSVTTTTTALACSASGSILREYWSNVSGSLVSAIPVNTTPASSSQLTSFEAPASLGDNYGQRIRGYLCAPSSGNYTFYIASDDHSELWLSSSDNASSKQKIASVTGYTSSRQWTKFTTQKSAAIYLQAGKKYYIEALHKEGAGGDHLAVGWQTPSNTAISIIPGAVLSPATTLLANQLPTVAVTSPLDKATFSAPASITITATATDKDGTISKVEFYNGSTKLGEDLSAPYSFSWTNVATGNYTLTAKATDNKGGVGNSTSIAVSVSSPVSSNPFPVAKNSTWKYHDKGVDLGTSWTALTYDDASWPSGKAVLGYGDPVTTTLSFGSNSTNKYPAYYLRHSFTIPDASAYTSLIFSIRRDDGAVVYLNGVEQFRTNMPTGTITYKTFASSALSGTDETNYITFKVPATSLKSGRNVVAVSLHQDNGASSDISFDMEIKGESTLAACSASGSILREYWSNVSGSLVSAIPVNTTPASSSQLASFEAPASLGDNYGQRIRGYLCAPSTGNYSFYIASDDHSELWLSSSDNASLKQKIASVTGYTSSRQWTKFTTQKSAAIYLQAGKKYYIEALHKEGAGGDHLAVGWQTPSNTAISIIPGAVLSPVTTSAADLAASTLNPDSPGQLASSVYPNPFENTLTLVTDTMQGSCLITLTDLAGRRYAEKVYNLSNQPSLELDFSALALKPGMYLLRLQPAQGQPQVIKVLKN
ncbi:Ig-like domain-containing protein [Rhodocytophaga aerolata]|uniref:Ig-like domain-containing protein n=1 Tax=Rhodocytophaga aerolata TaxID=455078 RepID=UPI00361A5A32